MNSKYLIVILFFVTSLMVTAQNKNNKTETFKVYGTCTLCKDRIEKTVKTLAVIKANWVIETNMLTVTYDSKKISKTEIQQKMATIGHDTDDFQATEDSYKKLPECCYYKRFQRLSTTHPMVDSLPTLENKIVIDTIKTTTKDIELIDNKQDKSVIVEATTTLSEVVVRGKIPSTYISSTSNLNTINIGKKELAKAACCNLSESFETSPSVDVSYADAVTGIKQIQLLGLSGNYTQITTENTPEIKGLSGSYALTFIPGPWIEGIQLTKGTGSVANGYESIAGQINIEEMKPEKMGKLFVNAYANNLGRLETSVNLAKKINDKWSTALLTHVNGVRTKTDDNNDKFLDIPIGRQFNVINRWKYQGENGLIGMFSFKILNDRRQAGEIGFNPSTDKFTTNKYGVGIAVQQYDFTGKLGYVFPQKEYKSIGFIFSANTYNNNSYYGLTKYDGQQNSIYANLIYQSIIGTTDHKFRTGLSFSNDNYTEAFNTKNYDRTETVNGAFIEYTYTPSEKLTAVAGFRLDYHNQYGFIATPRLNLKYNFAPKTNLRFSAGSGFRTANIFAENTAVFVSSRQYSIMNPNEYGYGLNPEKAWNYGFNFVHNFKLNKHLGALSIDAYRTDFTNQVVADLDTNPQKIYFYNLNGKSFSNSIQAEINYELFNKFDMRLAYRWLDVQTNYNGMMLEKPLLAKNRAFINLAYETNDKWKFDFTTQWLDKKRLPNTSSNPTDKQMGSYSKSYLQMAAQVSKQLGAWDVYIGGENITNQTQDKLFIDGNKPFSPYFDGSIVWGSVNGIVLYIGTRFKIKYYEIILSNH